MLNGLDLFSGIGALSLGLKGFVKPIAYCEIEPYAQKVLQNNMRKKIIHSAPIYSDVKTLSKKQLPPSIHIDVIYGGFPCQDISLIGNQKGLKGERSGLVKEVFRLTEELSPEFVFLENVPVIISNGLEEIIQRFDAIGYNAQWDIVSAEMFGAPHLRKRWFLLASKKDRGSSSHTISKTCEKRGGKDFERDHHKTCEDLQVVDPACTKPQLMSNTDKKVLARLRNSSKVFDAWKDPSWFQNEPPVGRMAHGGSSWFQRSKSLGNAVGPLCARYAFLRLLYSM